MTRRASLPGADELFRTNSPALSAVRQSAPEPIIEAPSTSVAPTRSSSKKAYVQFHVVALLLSRNLQLVANVMTKRSRSIFLPMNFSILIKHD